MKSQLTILLSAMSALSVPIAGLAQEYPTKPIKVVVPFAPGSSTDLTGRIVGNALSQRLKQQIIIENRAGAAGMIGAEMVAVAKPDGNTLLLGSNSTHGANVSLFKDIKYDPVRDFIPITQVSQIFYVLVARTSLPANTVAEVVQAAKAAPGKMTLATTGGISLLTGELFKFATGINMTNVNYKAPPNAFVDIASGRVDVLFQSPPTAMPQVAAGKMKAIAITARTRSVQTPGLPTVAEQGYPGFQAGAWIAYFAPAGTDKNIISKLHAELVAVLRDPGVRAQLVKNGTAESDIVANSPEELMEEVQQEIAKWKKLIGVIGVPEL